MLQTNSPSRAVKEQLPPHDDQAEAGALACVLLADGDAAAAMLDKLDVDSFYDVRHRQIYTALRRLRLDLDPLDSVALLQWLRDHGKTDAAGGLEYLTALPDKTPSPANFPTYLSTVNDRATRRALLRDAALLSNLAQDTSLPAHALADAARRVGEGHADALTCRRDDLAERQFNAAIEPPPLRPVFTLAGTCICTPGNLTTITSAVKTGKSAVVGAMAAAAMRITRDADTLGFQSGNDAEHALLWLDSEQSPDDFWHCVARAVRRAGLHAPPPWLLAYCLTGLGSKRAWSAVQEAVRIGGERHGRIHSILLDGFADFTADVNCPEEANAFVAELHALAIKHGCPVAGVIHYNPGTDKSRGHLGSQLERKAETNLALEKGDDGTTVIYSTKNRRAGISKAHGPCFKWDDAAGMHVSTQSRQAAKDECERAELSALAQDAFAEHATMRYASLQNTVKKLLTVSPRTAERKVSAMVRLAVIRRTTLGHYEICTPA